jgi:hypothetical protein
MKSPLQNFSKELKTLAFKSSKVEMPENRKKQMLSNGF